MTVPLLPPLAAEISDVPGPFWLIFIAGAVFAVLTAVLVLWLIFGSGPRRARGYRRSLRLVRQGKWQEGLKIVHELQFGARLSKFWEGRLRNAEGECHRAAGVEAVQARDFEKGLEHHLKAAELLHINAAEVRASVIEKMLTEVRKLFAGNKPDTEAVHAMITRVLMVDASNAEASFWQGMCHVREGKWELAQQALLTARGAESSDGARTPGAGFIDPPLYLGGVLLKMGQPKEALRYVTEANRIDGSCPLVSLHLGITMIAAGTDGNLALRALNRALGPRGLPMWIKEPEKAWIEGLPEGRSFVRKLAGKNQYACPLWGGDLRQLVRQGQMAMGQAHYRLEQYQAAADTFQKLLDESAPTHDVLRWLGLALTRLGRYHEAFKHLKTALDLEQPHDRLTAGYLAMCAACGNPDRPEDKGPNVAWAVRTVRQFEGYGDREWVWILGQVFGEALKLNMALGGDDQVFLCDHFVSVKATEREAALAYHQLAAEHPELLKPPYAWLYCRAALLHNLEHDRSLDLFARTFQTSFDARTFYASQQWDFEELEYAFLKQAAIKAPGQFPAALGPEYPPLGEAMLLSRSERLEKEIKPDAALASADVLVRLAPHSGRAHDRLAMLYYRRGKLDRAGELLRSWSAIEPENAVPWTRLAVVQHKQGFAEQAVQSMQFALERSTGRVKADLALLTVRLILIGAMTSSERQRRADTVADPSLALRAGDSDALLQAQDYLQICLDTEPGHAGGLWLLAAVRAALDDRSALAALSPAMLGKETDDARFHYFAAVSHLAAGNHPAVQEAVHRASVDPALRVEANYLSGWAAIHQGDAALAATALRGVALTPESPSASHARAIVGAIRFHQGTSDEAVQWWQGLDAERRTAWNLAEPLQKTLFLAGLHALDRGHFEHAADKFREAGKAGLREVGLGGLIQFALVKAGQRLLYSTGEE
jgi:tetratricopeptide (TPR) repeat protein